MGVEEGDLATGVTGLDRRLRRGDGELQRLRDDQRRLHRTELAIKLVIARRWNVGLEPFSLPIFIAVNNGNSSTAIHHRILFFGGVNF
jgi:hypothetical protein